MAAEYGVMLMEQANQKEREAELKVEKMKERLEKLTRDNVSMHDQIVQLDSENATLNQANAELRRAVSQTQSLGSKVTMEREISEQTLIDEVSALRHDLETSRDLEGQLRRDLNHAKSKERTLDDKLEEALTKRLAVDAQVADLQERVGRLQESERQLFDRLRESEARTRELEALQPENSKLTQMLFNMTKENHNLQTLLEMARDECARLHDAAPPTGPSLADELNTTLNRSDSRARSQSVYTYGSSTHDAMREYFYLTVMVVKMLQPYQGDMSALVTKDLYDRAVRENVSFQNWHSWVAKQVAQFCGRSGGVDDPIGELFRVSIDSTETVVLGKSKPYTAYACQVRTQMGHWVVHHRFTDFRDLHSGLKKIYKNMPGAKKLPKCPGKSLFNSMDPEVIADRRRRLQSYLQELMKPGNFPRTKLLDDFLQIWDMFKAVFNNDYDHVRYLVEHEYPVNEVDKLECTPLHYASSLGMLNAADLLIKCGAEVNVSDRFDSTPLHYAASLGRDEVIRLLMHNRARPDSQDKLGFSALHYAASLGNYSTVENLVKMGAAIDVRDRFQATPLHYAAASNRLNLAELLVNLGACVNVQDRMNFSPWRIALKKGHESLALFLESRGATTQIHPIPGSLKQYDVWECYYGHLGFTPMYKASSRQYERICTFLEMLDSPPDGSTPMASDQPPQSPQPQLSPSQPLPPPVPRELSVTSSASSASGGPPPTSPAKK
eukprot:gnl/Spiro4/16097_TR8655_c0_g1_i1.p1 gnl/Spiro4/16097_TR8655_c0_g1~~gnl/Spiro4/16097_TR8655_c0_g1_i1.p1  ORF type:complete len:789 (+),score=143.96 gnl/Spiro4/16097_TR8655_c0_g1_i1:197-2368(+)